MRSKPHKIRPKLQLQIFTSKSQAPIPIRRIDAPKRQSNTFRIRPARLVLCKRGVVVARLSHAPLNWRVLHQNPQNSGAKKAKRKKTYNSGYSLVVTHPTTNPPIDCLCMAERTGCPVLSLLWSYVTAFGLFKYMQDRVKRWSGLTS